MSAVFCHLSTALLRSGSEIRISRMEEKMKPTCKGTGMVVLGLLVLLAAGLAAAPETQAQVFSYRKPITIDRNQVGVSGTSTTTLSNYPMLYSVTDQDLRTTANGGKVQNANGWDIIFRAFDADNPGANICGAGVAVCTLDHEIESYAPTTGKLVAWVRIPVLNTISASSDMKIYIYYGNSDTFTSTTENPTGVWDTNFKAVWHLKETSGGTNAFKDSTSNGNHMTDCQLYGATGCAPTLNQTGKIGPAISFDGTGDHLSRAAAIVPNPDNAYPFTMCGWFSPAVNDPSGSNTIVSIGDMATASDALYRLLHNGGQALNPVDFSARDQATTQAAARSTTGTNSMAWYYACGVGNSATSRDAYINAGSKGSSSTDINVLSL